MFSQVSDYESIPQFENTINSLWSQMYLYSISRILFHMMWQYLQRNVGTFTNKIYKQKFILQKRGESIHKQQRRECYRKKRIVTE